MMMMKMMIFATLIVAFMALPFITEVKCEEKKAKYMGLGQFPNKTLLIATWNKYLYFVPFGNYDSWQNRWRYDNVSKLFLEDVWSWVTKDKVYEKFTEELEGCSLVKHGDHSVFFMKGNKTFILLVLDSQKIIGPIDGKKLADYDKLKPLSFTNDLAFFKVNKHELSIMFYDHTFQPTNKSMAYLRCSDDTVALKPAVCPGGSYTDFPQLQNGFNDHLDNFLFEDSENMFIFSMNGGKIYNASIDDYLYDKRTSNLLLFMLFLIIIIALIELCLLIKCGYDQAKQEEELSHSQGLGGTYGDYSAGGGTGGSTQGGGGAANMDPAFNAPQTPAAHEPGQQAIPPT